MVATLDRLRPSEPQSLGTANSLVTGRHWALDPANLGAPARRLDQSQHAPGLFGNSALAI